MQVCQNFKFVVIYPFLLTFSKIKTKNVFFACVTMGSVCQVCLEAWRKHSTATGGYFRCNRYKVTALDPLPSLALTCPHLSSLVLACPHLPSLALTCPHVSPLAHCKHPAHSCVVGCKKRPPPYLRPYLR